MSRPHSSSTHGFGGFNTNLSHHDNLCHLWWIVRTASCFQILSTTLACSASEKLVAMQIVDKIQGRSGRMLPFEGARLTRDTKRHLGAFKNNILMLLARDPVDRLSMAQFCATCDRVLAGTTTIGSASKYGGPDEAFSARKYVEV